MEILSKIEIYKFTISDAGRDAIISEIRRFKETHGRNWLKEFKREFPDFTVIVDLIANHDAETAFARFKDFAVGEIENGFDSLFARIAAKSAAIGFLDAHKPDVFKLHAELKAEIDKPRI